MNSDKLPQEPTEADLIARAQARCERILSRPAAVAAAEPRTRAAQAGPAPRVRAP